MPITQSDVQALLADLPVSSPQEVSHTTEALQMLMSLRNEALAGSGVEMLNVGSAALNIPGLISQLQHGQYVDAAVTLISVAGDAAGAFSMLTTAAMEAGAITSATSAIAQAGTVAGMASEAIGPAGIAIVTLIEVFRIPSGVNENHWKIFYIADVSGILTAWLFARHDISPHTRLLREARHAGYMRTDISDSCRQAHRRAHEFWVSNFSSVNVRRNSRSSVDGDWGEYWVQLGTAIERSFQPFPTGIGASMCRRLIRETRERIRQAERRREERRRAAAARAAAGGVWFDTPNGPLFMPDD